MRSFYHPIDKRSREGMVEYLTGHFRYDTMNSWNGATSYAHNLKIHNLGLNSEVTDKLYSLIQVEEFYEPLSDLIRDFGAEHNYIWQAGMNGRSGGYLVLYQGAREPSGYKSHCTLCGQLNYKTVAESDDICGVCRKPGRVDFTRTHMRVTSYPGRGTDQHEDFEDWSMYQLRERVELVQDFDRLAAEIVTESIWIANNYEVSEKSYFVEKTRLALSPVS